MMFTAGFIVLLICALAGALMDLLYRRLPNWLCAITAVAGLAFAWVTAGAVETGWAAAHAVIALIVGAMLFRAGLIGGGDAKFYAALAAWFPLSAALSLLLWTSVSGVIVVLGWVLVKRIRGGGQARRKDQFAMVPYGIAVAVGAVIARGLT